MAQSFENICTRFPSNLIKGAFTLVTKGHNQGNFVFWLEEKSEPIYNHFTLSLTNEDWSRLQMDEKITWNPTWLEIDHISWPS